MWCNKIYYCHGRIFYKTNWHSARSPALGWKIFVCFGLHLHLTRKCSKIPKSAKGPAQCKFRCNFCITYYLLSVLTLQNTGGKGDQTSNPQVLRYKHNQLMSADQRSDTQSDTINVVKIFLQKYNHLEKIFLKNKHKPKKSQTRDQNSPIKSQIIVLAIRTMRFGFVRFMSASLCPDYTLHGGRKAVATIASCWQHWAQSYRAGNWTPDHLFQSGSRTRVAFYYLADVSFIFSCNLLGCKATVVLNFWPRLYINYYQKNKLYGH